MRKSTLVWPIAILLLALAIRIAWRAESQALPSQGQPIAEDARKDPPHWVAITVTYVGDQFQPVWGFKLQEDGWDGEAKAMRSYVLDYNNDKNQRFEIVTAPSAALQSIAQSISGQSNLLSAGSSQIALSVTLVAKDAAKSREHIVRFDNAKQFYDYFVRDQNVSEKSMKPIAFQAMRLDVRLKRNSP